MGWYTKGLVNKSPQSALRGGADAADALRALLGGGPVALCVYPAPAASPKKTCQPEVLAFASTRGRLLVDGRNSAELAAVVDQAPLLCGFDAKALHRALLCRLGTGPQRWGCILLAEQLLLAGKAAALDLPSIAARHQCPMPSHSTASLGALADQAAACAQLVEAQGQALVRAGMQGVSKLEAAAVAPIAAMEHAGMPFDAAAWRALAERGQIDEAAAKAEVQAQLLAHRPGQSALPVDSDLQLQAALAQAGLPLPSLAARAVAGLPGPLAAAIGQLRRQQKLAQAYGFGFLQHAQADGRIRPTFDQLGASSGRMACHSPNLQAMVRGAAHRSCFAAPPGHTLLMADYQACELRILAQMSRDPTFCRAFAEGKDLHAEVASLLFERPVDKQSEPRLREVAKVVSFGLAYGMGTRGLAATLRVDAQRAENLLQRYHRRFPKIADYLERSAAAALERGAAQTASGRRLDLRSLIQTDRAAAQRVAKNMPIQGTNADLIKVALARLHAGLRQFSQAALVNCIHDEVVVQCRLEDAAGVAACVEAAMLEAGASILPDVPCAVDLKVCRTWGKT
jgi:DNA polymerase-1